MLTALGCKLNQAEIDALARQITAAGHQVVDQPTAADWLIVNTCAVTHVAARKSRQTIRRLAHAKPDLRVAVIGCYAETAPDDVAALAGVELVVPNLDKETTLARILARASDGTAAAETSPSGASPAGPLTGAHTRTLVKIQDGCGNHCTYCLVRIARGPSRSRPAEAVLAEIRQRVAEGYHEVVLTGVNIGAYGRDPGAGPEPTDLAALVRRALASGVSRLRLSSIEPWDVTTELIDLWRDPRLCRHLHLPLQSGCDATLRRMGRRYGTDQYLALAAELQARIPGVALTTDVIVGFPGETDDEFAATLDTVERAGLSRLHVFRYSPRPGTPAIRLSGAVDPRVAQARSETLIDLGRRQALAFHESMVGGEVEMLLESAEERPEGTVWSGLTDNYVRVVCALPSGRRNTLVRVHAVAADAEGLRGQAID